MFDFDTTPGVLMLVSLFLGVLASVIIGVIVRRNRRIRLDEQEELARLRGPDGARNPDRDWSGCSLRSRSDALDSKGSPCRSR